jgi:hypothetical protein
VDTHKGSIPPRGIDHDTFYPVAVDEGGGLALAHDSESEPRRR